VLLRPFAKLAEGSLAISPTSTRIAVVPERLADLETQVRTALGILPSRPVEHPGAAWASVLAELERLSVQTDAETLLGLDFEFVADGELRPARRTQASQARAWPADRDPPEQRLGR
jgi:hypothetical protein